MKATKNKKPQPGGEEKITNSDEQEVAVNKSTSEEGGYDEPVNRTTGEAESADEKDKKDKKAVQQKHSFKAN